MADIDDLDLEERDDEDTPLDREPKSSALWLARIEQAEKMFRDYQTKADNIDRIYSDLNALPRKADREFALFWANIQVLGPSIYSRPPIPVVVPRFKDRRPLYRTSSEVLERAAIVAFDMGKIDRVMRHVRDDLTIQARGASWVRYETKAEADTETERVCFEHKSRKDFLHEPSREWAEVGWVAGASYLSRKEMRKRFRKPSGKVYQNATFEVRKDARDAGAADNSRKAKVWEIWSKTDNRVYWVADGCEKLLDDDEPHLKLEGFFPCPEPAYGTTQRESLIPVPDMVYYKDQLEEVNELTNRIHALADAIKVRGFYPAGSGEIGDAIEAALKSLDDRQIMVPISNWAAWGGGAAKDTIVWLPIDLIVAAIKDLVALRKQVIDDVYQITGLSDIMRGQSDANETLGAQELKSQYGSVRIRDKQAELARVAKDMVAIASEIMAENFSQQTLLDMTQMELPTDAEIKKKALELKAAAEQQYEAQLQQIMGQQQDPAAQQQAAAQLQQQIMAQVQPAVAKLQSAVTIDAVMKFLRDNKIRPFVLDIETDSTIQADEDAEKQRRTEFLAALGSVMAQLGPLLQAHPEASEFAGATLKFATAPFRAGRELEGAIDDFVQQLTEKAGNPKPDPAAEAEKVKAQVEQQRLKMDMERSAAEAQAKQQQAQLAAQIDTAKADAEINLKAMDAQAKQQESAARLAQTAAQAQQQAAKHDQDMQKGALEMERTRLEIDRLKLQAALDVQKAQLDAEMAERSEDRAEQQEAAKQGEDA